MFSYQAWKAAARRSRNNSGSRAVLIPLAGPVVVDLVVVPGHDERCRDVRRHQVRVRLVEGITVPVIVKRVDLVAVVLAHPPGPGGTPARYS